MQKSIPVTDSAQKKAFAEALFSANMNPLVAGQKLFPDDFTRAARIASELRNDPEVLALVAELKKATAAQAGLSEDEIYIESRLKEIIDGKDAAPDDKVKALSKLMDLKGLSKQPVSSSVQIVAPRAIEVPVHGDDRQWENAAMRQQAELLNASRQKL